VVLRITFDPVGDRFYIVDSIGKELAPSSIGKKRNTLQVQIQLNLSNTVCNEWNVRLKPTDEHQHQVNCSKCNKLVVSAKS